MMHKMKALTLWQPHATLIAIAAKRYETRSWTTDYRGPLAIHAAKSKKGCELCYTSPFYTVLKNTDYPSFKWLPFGKIIAICKLVDIIQITDTNATGLSEQELAFGDFTPGRYAWYLQSVQQLEIPIPIRGKQRLWMWDYSEEMPAMQRIISVMKLRATG